MVKVGRHFEGFGYLFGLPQEIREMIYEYAVDVDDSKKIAYDWNKWVLGAQAQGESLRIYGTDEDRYFCYVNERTRDNVCVAIPEAMPAFIRGSAYYIGSHDDCKIFLDLMKPIERGLRSIRELYFYDYACVHDLAQPEGHTKSVEDDVGPYDEVLERCPSLRRLWVTIQKPCGHWGYDHLFEDNPFGNFVAPYSFERILSCKTLQTLNLLVEEPRDLRGTHNLSLVKCLVAWMQSEFKSRHSQIVNIRVLVKSWSGWGGDYTIVPEE